MSWPNYYVWDDYQKNFIIKTTQTTKSIQIVDPIYFSDSKERFELENNKKNILIFSFTPHKKFNHLMNFEIANYHTSRNAINFIQYILDVKNELNCNVIIKEKKEIGNLVCPIYRRYLDRKILEDEIILVDSGVSVHSMVKKADLVISWPYTSVGIIANFLKVPSVYFDPSGLLRKDNQSSHGIDLVQGSENLKSWVIDKLIKDNYHHRN
jgi:polysaccharide biosynthesis PFTS motif protein